MDFGPPEALIDMSELTDSYPHSAELDELVTQLLECGAILSQIVGGMVEWEKSGRSAPDAVPIPEVAHALIRGVVPDIRRRHSRRDVAVAARIVKEATEAMASEIFAVSPEWYDEIMAEEEAE